MMQFIENDTEILLTFKSRLLALLDKYRGLGELVHPNGTISIGKIPGKTQWFLFHLYTGLDNDEIRRLELAIGLVFPEQLRRFYRTFNGASLFGAGQISLWGMRGEAPLDMPNYQPISFVSSHLGECQAMSNSPKGAIYFGEYFGAYRFYVISGSDVVSVCKTPDPTPIEEWGNIELMIVDLTRRLLEWFGESGEPVDSAVNEYPVLFEGT